MTPHIGDGLVVGYVRVSTDRQAKEGQSLKAQEDSICSFAAAHGLKVDRIYRENGASGKDTERQELARLRSDLDKIDVVIVYRFDRISRSVVDLYGLLEEFQVAGVAFQSVNEGVDTGSAIGKFVMNILAGLAQMERELIGERTRDTLAKMQAAGKHVGRVPYGFRIDDNGSLEKDPDQQNAIRRMKAWRRRGATYQRISDHFGVSIASVHALVNTHAKTRNAKNGNGVRRRDLQ